MSLRVVAGVMTGKWTTHTKVGLVPLYSLRITIQLLHCPICSASTEAESSHRLYMTACTASPDLRVRHRLLQTHCLRPNAASMLPLQSIQQMPLVAELKAPASLFVSRFCT